MWGDPNYNSNTSTNTVISYISKTNILADEDGKVYFGTFGLDPKSTAAHTVEILNADYLAGITVSNAPNTYNVGEELDLTNLKVRANWKLGSTVDVTSSDFTVTGYDKTKTGDQEVTVSYKGFSKTFTVRNKASVDAADAFGTTFLAKTETPCADPNANNKEALEKVWSEIEESYTALTDDAKTIVKSTDANNAGTDLEKAVALYDHIVARYGNSFNFMERSVQSSASNYLINENTTSYIPLIVIVTLASVTFIGAALIIRKRKEN